MVSNALPRSGRKNFIRGFTGCLLRGAVRLGWIIRGQNECVIARNDYLKRPWNFYLAALGVFNIFGNRGRFECDFITAGCILSAYCG